MALSVSIEPASLSCRLFGKAQRHNHAMQKLQVRNTQSKTDTSVHLDRAPHPVPSSFCIPNPHPYLLYTVYFMVIASVSK